MIEIDDDEESAPDPPNMTAFSMTIENEEHKESLLLTHDELAINETVGGTVEISHRYTRGNNVIPYLFDPILEALENLLSANGWQEGDKVLCADTFHFSLTANYADGSQVAREGVFDRAHMPEAEWTAAAAVIRQFIGLFGFGDILSTQNFMRAMRTGEVKYCGVEFSSGGKLYHYRTTNLLIEVGDEVIVPVGEANYEKEAMVKTIEYCRWDDTPYPLEKTKEILRRADETNEREMPLLDEGESEDNEE